MTVADWPFAREQKMRAWGGARGSRSTSSKFQLQAPMKHQVPNTKHQAPNSREAPSSKLEARAAVWSLELGISLVFGAWFLVFRFRNFSGAWGLVLGVSHSGGSKTEMRCAPSSLDTGQLPPFSAYFGASELDP